MNKQQLFLLFALTSAAILLAALAVARGYVPLESVSLTIMASFVSVACFLQWWNKRRKLEVFPKGRNGTSSAFIWLLVPFTATAGVAIIQAMHEKWDIGDTIGLGFFMLFAGLSIYEILRRRRTKAFK